MARRAGHRLAGAALNTYVINHNTTAKPYRWTYDGTPLKAA
jgi:hypothetical protein